MYECMLFMHLCFVDCGGSSVYKNVIFRIIFCKSETDGLKTAHLYCGCFFSLFHHKMKLLLILVTAED